MKYAFVAGYFVGASCLIAFGWLMGKQGDSTAFVKIGFEWLVNVGAILAGIGTMWAAYVGNRALDTWKKQAKWQSSLNRLIECQEDLAFLCKELFLVDAPLSDKKKNEFDISFNRLIVNLDILNSGLSSEGYPIQYISSLVNEIKHEFGEYGFLSCYEKESLCEAQVFTIEAVKRLLVS